MATHKELRDGKLVDVDDSGNVVNPPVDGPAQGEGVTQVPLANSTSNPVGVVGPLEGGKGNDVPVSEVLTDAENAMVNTPGRVADHNKARFDEIKKDLEAQGKTVVDSDILRQIETEGRAAADRDNEEARKLPHDGPNQPENAASTVVREDGTVTTKDKPNMTATYLHGTRVLITDEQRAEYDAKIKELSDLQGEMGTADIPLGDPYWSKKQELDAFVARLKR